MDIRPVRVPKGAVVAVGDLAGSRRAAGARALGGGRHHGRRRHRQRHGGDAEGEAGRIRRPVGLATTSHGSENSTSNRISYANNKAAYSSSNYWG